MAKFTALKKIKVTFFSFFHYFAINLLPVDNVGGTVDASNKRTDVFDGHRHRILVAE